MLEPFDLSGMGLNDARRFVIAHLVSLRRTTEQRRKREDDLALWEGRTSLAERKGRADLASEARLRAQEIREDLDRLSAEETELERQVEDLKRQLRKLSNEPALAVDAQELLAHLQMAAGEPDETAEHFREWEAQTELENLKKKMKSENENDTGPDND